MRARETGDSALLDHRAIARFTGSPLIFVCLPGACAPGFMLPPASRALRPRNEPDLLRRLSRTFVQSYNEQEKY